MLLSIILIFSVFGAIVFSVSQKISKEMSASAIQNLSESLDLIESTIEAILRSEAEFQTLIAQEIARMDDPESYIRTYEKNQTMSKMSLILAGETEGVSNSGERFTEEGLDFSAGGSVMGLPVSQSYLNYMGTWSYTIKCPVTRDGVEIGTLYAEYVYDAIDQSLPAEGFYNKQASLYIMDAQSQRFVLKPKGMGKRSAGHLNLTDFYRANDIQDPAIQAEVANCLSEGRNVLFYHDIREVHALNYMWAVNGGTIFLVGYVPVESIQQEGRTVNQNIMIVVASLLAAFSLGPWYGVTVTFLKNLLKVIIKGTSTAYAGELCNFILGAAFSFTAGVIYHYKKSRKTALIGALAGAVVMALLSIPCNYFISYPVYTKFMAIDKIIAAYQAIRPGVNGLLDGGVEVLAVVALLEAVDVLALVVLEVGRGGLDKGLGGVDAHVGDLHIAVGQHLVGLEDGLAVQVGEVGADVGILRLLGGQGQEVVHAVVELMVAGDGQVVTRFVHDLHDGGALGQGADGAALDGISSVNQGDAGGADRKSVV